MRRLAATAIAATSILVLAACGNGGGDGDAGGAADGPGDVTSVVWGEHLPPNAPDETMTLYEVTIPPGAAIDPHEHPGLQIARIIAGTLTYEVLEGTVLIRRGSSGGDPGGPTAAEAVDAGTTVTLRPGDTVEEAEGMVHRARNDGDEAVVVVAAVLVPTGQPPSVPASAS